MSDLDKYFGGGLSPWSSNGRGSAKDIQSVRRDALAALAKDRGLAEYTSQEMEHTAALDRKRKALAGNDEFLNRLLAEEELSYVLTSDAIKREMFNPWPRGGL